MRLSCAIGLALVIGAAPAAAQNRSACAQAALKEYSAATVAIGVQLSAEAVMARRRLQEIYCAKSTVCALGTADSVPFAAMFAACLEDEAREQFGLEPRKRR